MEVAKANGIELTEAEAKTYFNQLNTSGAISDDELDMVAGGGWDCLNGLFTSKSDLTPTPEPIPSGRNALLDGERCPYCNGAVGSSQYNDGMILLGTDSNNNYAFCSHCGKKFSPAANKHVLKKL